MILANYNTRQVAEMTGKSVDTVRKWIRTGRLKGHKPPGCRDHVVLRKDFEQFWYGEDAGAGVGPQVKTIT